MALADILQAIRSGAAAEAASITAEADAEVTHIVAQARRSADEEQRRSAATRDADIRLETDRIVNQARLEADRHVRVAAERVYAAIRERARERLTVLRDSSDYREILGQLIDECRAVLPDAVTIHVAESDARTAARLLAERTWEVREVKADLDTIGGVVASAGDGRFVLNTFESRLERADRAGRQLVLNQLPALGGGL